MNLPTEAPLGLMMMLERKWNKAAAAAVTAASPGHSPLSKDRPRIAIERETDVTLNDQPYNTELLLESSDTHSSPSSISGRPVKRKAMDDGNFFGPPDLWIVRKGLWRLRVQPRQQPTGNASSDRLEIVFVAVKLDVFTTQKAPQSKEEILMTTQTH